VAHDRDVDARDRLSTRAIASIVDAMWTPPSSFTAAAPPSFTKRIALSTARSGLDW